MDRPEFVYVNYIKTTPERLWQALTEPAFTERYWGMVFHSDWKTGSTYVLNQFGLTIADDEQVVLEAEPYTRLSWTWHTLTPEWFDALNLSVDTRERLAAEPRSRVTFEIEPLDGEQVKLTVVHDGLAPDGLLGSMISRGWPRVLSNLKTLLETGEPLPDSSVARTPAELRRMKTATREEWLAARNELLEAEKEHTRAADELARRRSELPWVRVEKEYELADRRRPGHAARPLRRPLPADRLPLHVRPRLDRRLPVVLGDRRRLQRPARPPREPRRGVRGGLTRAGREARGLQAAPRLDVHLGLVVRQRLQLRLRHDAAWRSSRAQGSEVVQRFAEMSGTNVPGYTRERPGMSAFVLEDGVVYHTYSTTARGLDALWGMYPWLDRAPKGRNEGDAGWWKRRDEY